MTLIQRACVGEHKLMDAFCSITVALAARISGYERKQLKMDIQWQMTESKLSR